MVIDHYAKNIASVLEVISSHWKQAPKASRRNLSGYVITSRWLMAIGAGLMLLAAAIHVVRKAGDADQRDVAMGIVLLVGFVILLIGVAIDLFESVRTTKRPFAEHLDRMREQLPREHDLLLKLKAFDLSVLESAQRRLKLESTKVSSRLELIGGDGLKASLVGVGTLAYALLTQYQGFELSRLSLANIGFIGVALWLGMSLGAWSAKYGAAQWDYYSELLTFVIEGKKQETGK